MNETVTAAASTAARRDRSAPLRVLLWSPWGAGSHYSGPGMTAARLYRTAPPETVQITLVHGRRDHARDPLYRQQVMLSPIGQGPAAQYRFLRSARRWLRQHAARFDVFHGIWGYQATVAPALMAKRLGLPAVVKPAAFRVDFADKPGWRKLVGTARWRRRHLAELDAVIAISRDIQRELLGYGLPEEKVPLIPNGVDTDLFRPATPDEKRALRKRLGLPDEPLIVFAGAIVRRKRPHLLVEALARLRIGSSACRLVLAGPVQDVAYRRDIERLAADKRCQDRVSWLGMVDDMPSLLRTADVFALPSANEGLANAMLEALATGLPVVATPISGATDVIVTGENGILAEPTADLFARAIDEYLSDPRLAAAHGMAARKRIVARYSAHRVLQAHYDLFDSLVRGGVAEA